jgi:hypothetical protein
LEAGYFLPKPDTAHAAAPPATKTPNGMPITNSAVSVNASEIPELSVIKRQGSQFLLSGLNWRTSPVLSSLAMWMPRCWL